VKVTGERTVLVGGFNHLEKKSMGRMIPHIMEIKKIVPNHQPEMVC